MLMSGSALFSLGVKVGALLLSLAVGLLASFPLSLLLLDLGTSTGSSASGSLSLLLSGVGTLSGSSAFSSCSLLRVLTWCAGRLLRGLVLLPFW